MHFDLKQAEQAIQERLLPLLDSTYPSKLREQLVGEWNRIAKQISSDVRIFLDSSLSEFDYSYNEAVGVTYGKWCVDFEILLKKGLEFQKSEVELLSTIRQPIWILWLEISVVYPVYTLKIQKHELNDKKIFGIEVNAENDRGRQFSSVLIGIVRRLESLDISSVDSSILSLPVNIPSFRLETISGIPTFGQSLFNELHPVRLQIIDVNELKAHSTQTKID